MPNSIERFENYEIMISQERDTVFLPMINPKIQLDHEDIQATVTDGVLQVTDGKVVVHFLDFPESHSKLIHELGRICMLDVSNPDELKDFDVPVK
jgi:hypothetical protein